MIVQAVRMIDAACRDVTIGIAAQLATLTIDSGDTRPSAPTILNETASGDAARDSAPEGVGPWLMIASGDLNDRALVTLPYRDWSVDILLRYVERAQSTPTVIIRADYIIEAIRKTLMDLLRTDALRLRAGVAVIGIKEGRSTRLTAPISDDVVTWGMLFTLTCRSL